MVSEFNKLSTLTMAYPCIVEEIELLDDLICNFIINDPTAYYVSRYPAGIEPLVSIFSRVLTRNV